jgi:hypothetical protein
VGRGRYIGIPISKRTIDTRALENLTCLARGSKAIAFDLDTGCVSRGLQDSRTQIIWKDMNSYQDSGMKTNLSLPTRFAIHRFAWLVAHPAGREALNADLRPAHGHCRMGTRHLRKRTRGIVDGNAHVLKRDRQCSISRSWNAQRLPMNQEPKEPSRAGCQQGGKRRWEGEKRFVGERLSSGAEIDDSFETQVSHCPDACLPQLLVI